VLDAVIYIGSKPVYQGERVVLEAHILDFSSELYGHHIQVELISKLRDDENITSEKELIKQIKRDIDETRLCLKKIEVTNK
jgi:riboflavin kinase/FMN adenylyltransferase